jgi:hypothetical protein
MDELLRIAKNLIEIGETNVVRVEIEGVEYKVVYQIMETGKFQLIIKER